MIRCGACRRSSGWGCRTTLGSRRPVPQPPAGWQGLELCPGYTWLDVAEMFNAVTDGARMRAKGMGSVAALSTGDNVVVGAIRAMLPALFTNAEAALIEGARPR